MNEHELDDLLDACPTLYHMAERGSWPSIKEHGLLSTKALLELYAIAEPKRTEILRSRRPAGIEITSDQLPRAVIRDQIPMTDAGLQRALPARLQPSDWYEILNGKVFFWLSESRLHRLTGAGAYRDREHDVIEINSRPLIEFYRDKIWLCPINSGCTKPFPRQRDESIFARIDVYPYDYWKRKKRKRNERAVELAVDWSVPDIQRFVRRVIVKRGEETLSVIE